MNNKKIIEIKELEKKIKKIKDKIFSIQNSCSSLQKEEWESYEQDRIYLKILENRLEGLKKK